nr:RabGAP TBC domain containing protein [Haemonchus contortus]
MHWFLTLFSTCLPRDCVLRVWDALMLQGSEILLRTAIALWSRMSRRILRTSSADEFYTLMGKLCKELAEMNQEEQDHIMTGGEAVDLGDGLQRSRSSDGLKDKEKMK